MVKTSRAKKPKKDSLAREVESLSKGLADHVATTNRRFRNGQKTMANLATKDDLSTVMLDQASKADVEKLTKLLLDEEGQPKFATKEDMAPVLAVYQGGVFTKSLILGLAAVIGAIVGIGWGLITLAQWVKGGTPPTLP